jgi:fatty-acyl-CoA synthase
MAGPTTVIPDDFRVIPETADADLLSRPLRSLQDIEVIEQVSVAQRVGITDFANRIALALEARDPNDVAIHYVPDGDVERTAERVSFQQLRVNIERTAALLRGTGIQRTDVVAVLLPAVPAIYWSILGAMATAIVFPVNWMLEPRALLHLLKEANVKAVIALGPTPGFQIWESIESATSQLGPDVKLWSVQGPNGKLLPENDLAAHIAVQNTPYGVEKKSGESIGAYVHSGGTTGVPKIVKLSHFNMSYRHWTLQNASRLCLGEVIIHDTPMFHVGGLVGRCLPPLASGASVLIPSVMGARDKRYIANYWRFVEKYRVTRLSGVPTTLAVLAKSAPDKIDLSSLQPYFITGSTALPLSVRQEFERVSGVRVLNSYGMTENTASIAIDPRDGDRKAGSSGIRVPYTEIRVVSLSAGDGTQTCRVNEIGMLQIRGPGVAADYVNAKHKEGSRSKDGWLISGDLGRIDEDGYVFITGRVKDVIIRGGHNIDPALIEEPLLQIADVLHAAAVGKPDSYAGEVPVAYVQLVPGSRTTEAEILAFVASRIAERAAMPKEILIVDKLPLTDVGKPIKAALRCDIAERTFRAVLESATGLSPAAGDLTVTVVPDPTRGGVVSIKISKAAAGDEAACLSRIAEAMAQYTFAYTVGWV